jgi:hypothetical protein
LRSEPHEVHGYFRSRKPYFNQEVGMSSKPFKRLLLVGATALTLVLAVAPASYAGEDDGDDTATTEQPAPAPAPAPEESSSSSSSSSSSGSGSSDTQVAVGGVQTGGGWMASATDANTLLPLSIGGAIVLLSSAGFGGLALRRR